MDSTEIFTNLLLENSDECNTRHGILNADEVEAIKDAIAISKKIDDLYTTYGVPTSVRTENPESHDFDIIVPP